MLALLLWQMPQLSSLAVAVLAIALAAVLWLYPLELSQTVRRWRWFLPVLRAIVIAALAISILRPVASRPKTSSERGAVALLVDQSRSMTISDTSRKPAEKMSLAEALGLLNISTRQSETAGLRNDVQNLRMLLERVARHRSEAEYARLAERGQEPAKQRLDESTAAFRAAAAALAARAPKLKHSGDLPQRLVELTRLPPVFDERALRELRTRLDHIAHTVDVVEADADAKVYRDDPRVHTACDEIDKLSRIGLVERMLFDTRNGLVAKLQPDTPIITYGFSDQARSLGRSDIITDASGDRSDIVGAVQSIRNRLRDRGVEAIVLLSDGRQVGADLAPHVLETPGPPVFTVGVASGQERRDVSVTAVRTPASAFVGENATVRVEIRALGCRGKTLDVWLNTPAGRATKQVTVGDSTEIAAEFRVIFPTAGALELSAGVAPMPGEATIDNNTASAWVNVLDETVAVTIAAGSDSRDYRALSDALSTAPWITLQKSIVSGDAEYLPLTPEEILSQNVLVLMDVDVWSLSDAQWDAVQQLIAERGGSVVLQVSDDEILREYEDHSVASKLLPFDPVADVSWRIWPGEQPRYTLVQPSAASSVSAFVPQPHWPALAPVLKYLAMPQLKPNADALLVERDSGAAALAQTHIGLGRAYLLGIDETWRWQSTAGKTHDDLFWQTLIRNSIEQPYAAHEANFSLDVDRIHLEPNQPLHVRAKVLRDDGSPSEASSQELLIFRDGQMMSVLSLSAATNVGPGRYEATITDLGPGEYELRLSTGSDLLPSPSVVVRVSPSSEAELADLSGDDRLLRHIADATGGEFLSLDQLSSLPGKLSELRERQSQWQEYPLWDSPYLFLFVLAGLSLEWSLRKQAGLA